MRLLGSIDPLPSGRFRYRVTVRGKASRTTYDTEQEALAVQLLTSERAANPPADTLGTYGALFLDWRETKQRAADIASARSRWRQHVDGTALAATPLRELTTRQIEAWVETLSGSVQTRKHTLNLVRRCLDRARREHKIETNPAIGVHVDGTIEDAWTYLSESEQRSLVDVIVDPEWMIVAFAIGTGLRQGEQWSLRLVDVEADRGAVTVRFGGPGTPTKTRKPRRVPLLPWVQAVLDAWLDQLPAYLTGRRKTYRNESGLVFPTRRGCRRRDKKPPRAWAGWLRAAHVEGVTGAPVTWHSLRHTCASMLVSGAWGRRWTLQEVAELLGHTSTETTERYAHLAEGTIARAAAETVSRIVSRDPENQRATVDSNHWPSAPEAQAVDVRLRDLASLVTPDVTRWALEALQLAADGDPRALARALPVCAVVAALSVSPSARRTGEGVGCGID